MSEKFTFREMGPAGGGGIGDLSSPAVGSGARFNSGKPDLALIPLTMMSDYFAVKDIPGDRGENARCALFALGRFQESHDHGYLYDLLDTLGEDGWEEAAHVFSYGKKKYVAWNWAKGMPWSVPLACAARHLLSMIVGAHLDNESGLPHRGHVYCNVIMLLEYVRSYPEGNDLPTRWLPKGEVEQE